MATFASASTSTGTAGNTTAAASLLPFLKNENGSIFSLPQSLKARCLRVHGWSEAFADKSLLGYRQFMKLKLQHEDWDASILSPSLAVDLVWHQHMLDPVHYVEACQAFTGGHIIGHNPDGGLDLAARAERIKATKFSLRALFGRNVDPEVWSFGDVEKNDNNGNNNNNNKENGTVTEESNRNNTKARRIESQASRRPGPKTSRLKPKEPTYNFMAMMNQMHEPVVSVQEDSKKDKKRRKPENKCFTLRDVDYRFSSIGDANSNDVGNDDSNSTDSSNDDDDVAMEEDTDKKQSKKYLVFPRKSAQAKSKASEHENASTSDGEDSTSLSAPEEYTTTVGTGTWIPESGPAEDKPITVRLLDQKGEETIFKIKKSTKMHNLFDRYADRKAAKPCALRFLLDGEEICGDQTPFMLELNDEDQIHVMPLQTGC